MATIDSLANETLSDIFEYLAPPLPLWNISGDLQKGRYEDLRAAALVCSRWREPAQRALFDEVHLPDPKDSRGALFRASKARPRYRTRSLCVHSAVGDGSGDWLENAMACVELESLDVHDVELYYGEDRISWGPLSHPAFHGLKHIGLMYPENFKDPSDTSQPFPFKLSSLALWLDDGNGNGVSPKFVRALCDASLSNLSKLSLRISSPTAGARFFTSFTLLGPQLRTLVLAASRRVFEGHFHIFGTLQCLMRLEINISWDIDHNLAGFEFLGAVLDALPSPPTIKHLRIKIPRVPRGDSLKLVVEDAALVTLVRLELWGFNERASLDDEQEAGLEAARRVLAERGATIVLGGI